MGDQQVQHDHELALSLALIAEFASIPLPPDFQQTSSIWLTAAGDLVKSLPNIPDREFQGEVVDALEEIIHTIDKVMESLDLMGSHLPLASRLLLRQSFTRQLRHILLRDPDDFRRAVHILEILTQLCDPIDTDLLRRISVSLGDFLRLATTRFLDSRRPSEFGLIQLLETFGIHSDFVMQAKSILERVNDISHISAEVLGCSPQAPIIQDVDSIIATIDNLAERCNPSDQDLEPIATLLSVQVAALQARFRLLGHIPDLHRSVTMSEIASQLHNPTHPLAYVPNEDPLDVPDLDQDIAFGEELLVHSHEETRVLVSRKLAQLLFTHFIATNEISNGERVLQLCEDTLPFVVGREFSRLSKLRARVLCHLSRLGRQFPDLRQSLGYIEEGVGVLSPHRADFLWHQLKNAAVAGDEQAAVSALHEIHARSCTHWEVVILDVFYEDSESYMLQVIEALKQRCTTYSLTRDERSVKPFAVILVMALWWRYHLSGNTGSLQEALSLRSRLGPPGTYGLDIILYGSAAILDFNGVERRPEFAKALAASSSVLSSTAQFSEVSAWKTTPGQREVVAGDWHKHVDRSFASRTFKNQNGMDLRALRELAYDRSGDDSDFHISRREYLLQLSVCRDDTHRRCRALRDLGSLHSQRYNRRNEIEDLKQALDWYQQGISTLGGDDQTSEGWGLRVAWAEGLFQLHKTTKSVGYSDLLQAHDYLRRASAYTHNSPEDRLLFLDNWIYHLSVLAPEDGMKHALEICELALSLLEEQNWAASSFRLSLNARHEKTLLAKMVAGFAFTAGIGAGGIAKAVELMEASQALVWGQLHRLRAPLGDLEAVSPVLASRFQQLSQSLERRMGLVLDDASQRPQAGDADPLGTNNWQLNRDMNRAIEEIRGLPGFEKFLQRRSFGEEELRMVAKDGPVVVLLPSPTKKGIALVLQQGRQDLVDLPVTYSALLNWHRSLQCMANARDYPSHEESDFSGESIYESVVTDPVAGSSNTAGNPRSLRKKGHETSVEVLLEILWRQVVEPILGVISGHVPNGKGKSKMWETPKLEDRQRIWWCCLGEFSFLPIHAAGIYRGASSICLSDFFISSYTPTLSALLDARNRPVPTEIRILAAAQPSPGMGWSRLSQVQEELREIAQVVPSNNLISVGGTDELDLEGQRTSVKNVVEKLPEASVLHLACHGTQNPRDPMSSGFILAEGEKLTIEELIKYRLPNAHTAILSACHTASNDVEQPSEAMNLSSAFMFLGFSNILATKWPMSDSDGPVIAKAVYRALFKISQACPLRHRRLTIEADMRCSTNQQPKSDSELAKVPERKEPHTKEPHPTLIGFSLARVVDDITRDLRLMRKVPAKRWATFVHVGI